MQPIVTNIWIIVFGAIAGISIVAVGIWWVVNHIKDKPPLDALMMLAAVGFVALVIVWSVDKVMAVQRHLLTDDESKQVLNLIQTMITVIFTYYFTKAATVEKKVD